MHLVAPLLLLRLCFPVVRLYRAAWQFEFVHSLKYNFILPVHMGSMADNTRNVLKQGNRDSYWLETSNYSVRK